MIPKLLYRACSSNEIINLISDGELIPRSFKYFSFTDSVKTATGFLGESDFDNSEYIVLYSGDILNLKNKIISLKDKTYKWWLENEEYIEHISLFMEKFSDLKTEEEKLSLYNELKELDEFIVKDKLSYVSDCMIAIIPCKGKNIDKYHKIIDRLTDFDLQIISNWNVILFNKYVKFENSDNFQKIVKLINNTRI